jgi:hypothetical protein
VFVCAQEGYVHLAQHGKLTLDSKKLKGTLEDFLQKENRFSTLTRKNPEASAKLHHHLQVRVVCQPPWDADCWAGSWRVRVVGSRWLHAPGWAAGVCVV